MKRTVRTLALLVVGFFLFLYGETIGEHIAIQQQIDAFVQKGVLDEIHSTETIKYYIVSRETYYPNELERQPFYQDNYLRPGDAGDIFVTMQSPLVFYPGVHQFVSFFFGGHAAVLDENNRIYETIGIPNDDENFLDVLMNGGQDTKVTSNIVNYWLNPHFRTEDESDPSYLAFGTYYRKEWVGLRVKGVTQGDIDGVISYLDDKVAIEAQYNFFFIINTKNRYYCTDMVTRAYESLRGDNGERKYTFNKDGVAVTVNDMIMSKDTYISYYVTTDKNNVKYVYYIG